MDETKKFYLSRTVWVGVIEFLIGALMVLAEFLQKGDYSPAAFVLMGVGVLTIALRYLTVMPIE